MAYSSISNSNFAIDAPAKSSDMQQLNDNVEAMRDGTGIQDDKILNRHIAASAIKQSQLDTGFSENSTTSDTVQDYVTSAGEYGFQTAYKISSTSDSGARTAQYEGSRSGVFSTWSTSYVTYQRIEGQSDTVTRTMYAITRYMNASPPYNLGDGNIPVFVFLHIRDSKIISVSSSDSPPWAYNGPTDITKTKIKVLSELTGKVEEVERPITNDIKNADMHLIPHPFASKKASDSVIILDPPETLYLMDLMETGESINELIHNDYLRLDNSPITRNAPPGVIPSRFKWKNTVRRAGEALGDRRLKRGPYSGN